MFEFHKMHGLGNYFLFFDELMQDFSRLKQPQVIRTLCDARFGVGADGLVFVMPPVENHHHCRMQVFNADGSEAEMCGNAIRGVAHWYKKHHLGFEPILVETRSGLRQVYSSEVREGVCMYRVEMGVVNFDLTTTGELVPEPSRKPLTWDEEPLSLHYANVGNPHAVLFMDTPLTTDAQIKLGAWLETHPNHPRRINVEFVEILSPHEVNVTVWERGCGMTHACGTGGTAVAASGIKAGKLQSPVTVHMPGGDLILEQGENGVMFMTGPVQEVADGHLAPSFVDVLFGRPQRRLMPLTGK